MAIRFFFHSCIIVIATTFTHTSIQSRMYIGGRRILSLWRKKQSRENYATRKRRPRGFNCLLGLLVLVRRYSWFPTLIELKGEFETRSSCSLLVNRSKLTY